MVWEGGKEEGQEIHPITWLLFITWVRIKQNRGHPLTEMPVLHPVIQLRKPRFREAKVPEVLAGRQG